MDLILVLTQHVGGSFGYLRQDNLLLLETFYYIFMDQEPDLIAKTQLLKIEVWFIVIIVNSSISAVVFIR